MEILYVEDHPNNTLLIQRVIQNEGHQFIHAVDGESGMAILQTHQPDLIFVDLRLPGEVSGFDLIRHIRATPALQAIPVVVLTAYGHGEAEVMAEEAGCNNFLHKPADIREVREVIRQYVGDPVRIPRLPLNGRSWATLPAHP